MTDQQIKEMFSTEVLRIGLLGDGAKENILRKVLFDEGNRVNWQNAYRVMLREMPELKLEYR